MCGNVMQLLFVFCYGDNRWLSSQSAHSVSSKICCKHFDSEESSVNNSPLICGFKKEAWQGMDLFKNGYIWVDSYQYGTITIYPFYIFPWFMIVLVGTLQIIYAASPSPGPWNLHQSPSLF